MILGDFGLQNKKKMLFIWRCVGEREKGLRGGFLL